MLQKKRVLALILVALIAVIAVVVCFSSLGSIPTLSEAKKAALEKAFYRDIPFYDPIDNTEGARYYGTYTDSMGQEYDLLFVSYSICQDGFGKEDFSEIPVDIVLDGKHFTHRTPFVFYRYYKSKHVDKMYLDSAWISLYNKPSSELTQADKKVISEIHKIHIAYETRLYGPILADTELIQDSDIQKQIRAAWKVYHSDSMSGLVRSYGNLDGYYVILDAGGAQSELTKEIGSHAFYYPMYFNLLGYKDGVFYNIEELYKEGKFSNKALAELAAMHKEANEEKGWISNS